MTDTDSDFELERGSGNVFADFGVEDASVRQFRAILAAEIIKTLDAERLTVREAEARTGIAAADFSRIRQVRLDRFTIDRLMRILDKLNRDVQVKVSVVPRKGPASRPARLAA
jgi:predicted XRE-type DNA-binding protein